MPTESNTGPKLCECGCGQPAPLSTVTRPSAGYVKGEPTRFVSGHNGRGQKRPPETVARMSASLMGKHRGKDSGNWKGGTHYQYGRKKVYVGRDHPMADKAGYVFEYRLVAAASLGRMLSPAEKVHHIDLDETNNAAQNLVVVSGSDHRKIHWRIKKGADPVEAVRLVLG